MWKRARQSEETAESYQGQDAQGRLVRLAVPLTEAQVRAAGDLHGMLEGWNASEQTLDWLANQFPSNTELETVYLKARILNLLYVTRIFAIRAMAQHIVDVFSQGSDTIDDCPLVESIAYLEASDRHHVSFASKYCHFFVDNERFPLFDSYALRIVRLHLGRGNYHSKWTDETYPNLHADLRTLRARISFGPTVRELDHYLWLRGQWKRFEKKGGTVPIGDEVKHLFASADSDERVRTLISRMRGA